MAADAAEIEKVSESPDEFGFLAHIVAHPVDDNARLVYADWLEERADPRAGFLRTFIESYRSSKPLPNLAGVPAAWADLVGLTIISKIAEAGLQQCRDELLALARPALRIHAHEAMFDNPSSAPAALGTTRLGGDPTCQKAHRIRRPQMGFLSTFSANSTSRTFVGPLLASLSHPKVCCRSSARNPMARTATRPRKTVHAS
jgi:uncharacterized protein (TIGR02996 family)